MVDILTAILNGSINPQQRHIPKYLLYLVKNITGDLQQLKSL